MSEITSILAKFQKGYEEKNPGNVSALISEIFLDRHDLLTLGTSTDEVCIGRDEVIKLIHDDWDGGWGDFKIDLDGAKIESDGDVAWFYSNCTVKYSFEDSDDEKNRSYVDFVKSVIKKQGTTPKQRLAFLNWALGIHFHERKRGKREYQWPSELSGMLVKVNNKWKIATLHFAVSKPNYPDERFEEFYDDYQVGIQNSKNKILTHDDNKADDKLLQLLKCLEDNVANDAELSGLQLDSEQVLVFETERFEWIIALGVVKQSISENEIFNRSLQEIKGLLDTGLQPEDKLFQIKRNIAYALKEAASGTEFTWPIRLTAVVEKGEKFYKFRHKHFSYPFYWIFEGKL